MCIVQYAARFTRCPQTIKRASHKGIDWQAIRCPYVGLYTVADLGNATIFYRSCHIGASLFPQWEYIKGGDAMHDKSNISYIGQAGGY